MVWGYIALGVGILYGWLAPGRQDKSRIFVTALIWGLIIGVILALIGLFANTSAVGFGTGFLGFVISVVIITLLFILGVWIGDLIESATSRRKATR